MNLRYFSIFLSLSFSFRLINAPPPLVIPSEIDSTAAESSLDGGGIGSELNFFDLPKDFHGEELSHAAQVSRQFRSLADSFTNRNQLISGLKPDDVDRWEMAPFMAWKCRLASVLYTMKAAFPFGKTLDYEYSITKFAIVSGCKEIYKRSNLWLRFFPTTMHSLFLKPARSGFMFFHWAILFKRQDAVLTLWNGLNEDQKEVLMESLEIVSTSENNDSLLAFDCLQVLKQLVKGELVEASQLALPNWDSLSNKSPFDRMLHFYLCANNGHLDNDQMLNLANFLIDETASSSIRVEPLSLFLLIDQGFDFHYRNDSLIKMSVMTGRNSLTPISDLHSHEYPFSYDGRMYFKLLMLKGNYWQPEYLYLRNEILDTLMESYRDDYLAEDQWLDFCTYVSSILISCGVDYSKHAFKLAIVGVKAESPLLMDVVTVSSEEAYSLFSIAVQNFSPGSTEFILQKYFANSTAEMATEGLKKIVIEEQCISVDADCEDLFDILLESGASINPPNGDNLIQIHLQSFYHISPRLIIYLLELGATVPPYESLGDDEKMRLDDPTNINARQLLYGNQ